MEVNMKKVGLLIVVCLFAITGWATEGWLTDMELATEKASKEGKHLLLDFSGSDWCGWCIRLDKEVFQKENWKEYAAEHLIQVLVDFPQDKSKQSKALQAQNEALAKQYKVKGFPTVIILSPEGRLVDRTGYQRGGATAYIKHIKSLILNDTESE
jgi:thioredoxin-related protein